MIRFAVKLMVFGAIWWGPSVGAAAEPPSRDATEVQRPSSPGTQHPLEIIERMAVQKYHKWRFSPAAANEICEQYYQALAQYLQNQQISFKVYLHQTVPPHARSAKSEPQKDFIIEILPNGATLFNQFAALLQAQGFSLRLQARRNLEQLLPRQQVLLVRYAPQAFYISGRFLITEQGHLHTPATKAAVAMLEIFNQAKARYLFSPSLKLNRHDAHRSDLRFIDRAAKIFLAPLVPRPSQLNTYLADTLTIYHAVHQALRPGLPPATQTQLRAQARRVFYNSSYLLAHTVLELNFIVYAIIQNHSPYQIKTIREQTDINLNPEDGIYFNLRLPRPCLAVDNTYLPSVLKEEKFQKLFLYLTELLESYQSIHHQMNILHTLSPKELRLLEAKLQTFTALPLKITALDAAFPTYWQQHYVKWQKRASARIKDYHKYMGQHPCHDPFLPPAHPPTTHHL